MATLQTLKNYKDNEALKVLKLKKPIRSQALTKQPVTRAHPTRNYWTIQKEDWVKGNMNTCDSLDVDKRERKSNRSGSKKKKGSMAKSGEITSDNKGTINKVQQKIRRKSVTKGSQVYKQRKQSLESLPRPRIIYNLQNLTSFSKEPVGSEHPANQYHIKKQSFTTPHKAVLEHASSFNKLFNFQSCDDIISLSSFEFSESFITRNHYEIERVEDQEQNREEMRMFEKRFKDRQNGIINKTKTKQILQVINIQEKNLSDRFSSDERSSSLQSSQPASIIKYQEPNKSVTQGRQSLVVTPGELSQILKQNDTVFKRQVEKDDLRMVLKKKVASNLSTFHPYQVSQWGTLNKLVNEYFMKSQNASPRCILNELQKHDSHSTQNKLIVDQLPERLSGVQLSPEKNIKHSFVLQQDSETQQQSLQINDRLIEDYTNAVIMPIQIEVDQQEQQPMKSSSISIIAQQKVVESVLDSIFAQIAQQLKTFTKKYRSRRKKVVLGSYSPIDTTLYNNRKYLRRLVQDLRCNKKYIDMILEAINKPIGLSSQKMLAYLRLNEDQFEEDSQDDIVIPIDSFVNCQQKIVSEIASNSNKNDTLFLQFWHRALYECFNEILDRYRPYGLERQPFAWQHNRFYHKLQIQQTDILQLLEQVIEQVCSIALSGVGVLIEKEQYHHFSRHALNELTQDRLCRLLTQDCYMNEHTYLNYDQQRTYLLMELSYVIEHWMVRQATGELSRIFHKAQPAISQLISL